MTTRAKKLTITSIIGAILIAIIITDIFVIIPTLVHLRTTIDNDRASKIVITQQQSNLAQLTQDLASIQTKQLELEKNIWTFSTEDTYFSTLEQIAKNRSVTIDATAIADATPSDNILPRPVTIIVRGKLDRVLSTVSSIQSVAPIISIQKLLLEPDTTPGDVQVSLTGTTLWK